MAAEPAPTVLASLNAALTDMMAADDRVVVIGEDLLDPYGGAFKVTRGLSTKYPGRVFTTPISEGAIVGLSIGMAIRGRRPIAEIMFGDFTMLAADQLVNSAAKFNWMFDSKVTVPLVVRTPMGGRRGYGPTHSQSLEKHLLGVPGLWVVAPHVLGDPGGLLKQAAIDWDHPVLFIENKTDYGRRLEAMPHGLRREVLSDAEHPFPTTLLADGAAPPDALVLCYGGAAPHCLDAVRRLRDDEGLRVDLVVFTQLSPIPRSHLERVADSRRPSVCVYVEEGTREAGWGAEMVAQVAEIAGTLGLRLAHQRVAAKNEPIASSRELEQANLPQSDAVVSAVLACL